MSIPQRWYTQKFTTNHARNHEKNGKDPHFLASVLWNAACIKQLGTGDATSVAIERNPLAQGKHR